MTDSTTDPRRVRRAHLTAALLAVTLGALALLLVIALSVGDLPDRMATHFDLSGTADDDMAVGVALGLFLVIGFGLPALLVGVFAASEWWRGPGARASAGFLAGFAVGLNAVFAALVLANRGAVSPEQVSLDPWVLAAALGLGILVGVAVARVVPHGLPSAVPEPVRPVVLASTERASWFGRATTGSLPVLALVAAVVVLVAAALASGIWWLWLVTALVAVLVVGLTSFVVRVDASGVTWRSAVGVPRGHIPLAEVTDVAVVEASATDFGGFGLRMRPGALGLITRRGSALQVTHGRRQFVATVDDAGTGAGLLLGYVEEARRR